MLKKFVEWKHTVEATFRKKKRLALAAGSTLLDCIDAANFWDNDEYGTFDGKDIDHPTHRRSAWEFNTTHSDEVIRENFLKRSGLSNHISTFQYPIGLANNNTRPCLLFIKVHDSGSIPSHSVAVWKEKLTIDVVGNRAVFDDI